MKITIYKSRKLQVNEYEPYEFGYGLEQEVDGEIHTHKEQMENIVDEWINKETEKWEKYKKLGLEKHIIIKEKPLTTKINGVEVEIPF